jgi:hypothetical protein
MTALLGSITGNDMAGLNRFATFLGRKPDIALLAFNQNNPAEFASSIDYIDRQAKSFIAAGCSRILWSVPVPGAGQLEAVVYGTYDGLYADIARRIVTTSAKDSRYRVRLPWEANLDGGPGWGQTNVAKDAAAKWCGDLHREAQERIARVMRPILGPKALLIACPNICENANLDPRCLIPGPDLIDCIALDFYMQRKWNKPGDFAWFRDHARGLNYWRGEARRLGLYFGLSEWGMDSDDFLADFNACVSWIKANDVHHHCWWDRPEVIDCRISDGTRPKLGAAYKAAIS